MRRLSPGLVPLLVLLSSTPLFAQKEYGFDNRKGSGQPYLTPAETVAKFKIAPEFEIKLFAGEPQVINPVAFSIDEKGRVWCLECFEYPSRTPKGKAPRDRIVILEDTDGDGVCDKRTVFAEGKDFPVPEERAKAGLGAFDLATGLEVGHGGVWVGAPPYLWFIEAKDDKPVKFETVLKGFGSQDTHETLNTFQWGPDGWLYGMQGIFTQSTVKPLDGPETRMNAAVWRLHPKTKKFEIFAEGTSNPWGMDWRNTDGQFILACCVIPHLYHIVPGGIYKRQAGASFNPYSYGFINEISDHTFHKESGWAHAGLISLDAPHIPAKYRNSVIFGSIHGCSLKQNILKPNGSSFTASRGDDFLVSGDKNVRPINLKWGPNGDIYLIDWHDQMPCHQAKADEWDYERGRVYRINVKGRAAKKAEDLGKKSPEELVDLMKISESDPHTTRTALRLLHEAGPDAKYRAQVQFIKNRKGYPLMTMTRLGVAVDGTPDDEIANFDPKTSLRFRVLSESPNSAGMLAADTRTMSESNVVTQKTVNGFSDMALQSLSPPVRRELASAAIRLSDKHDVSELVHSLMSRKQDANDPLIPHLTWQAYEKVIAKQTAAKAVEKELAWLAEQAPDNVFVRDQIVPKVMRRLVATGNAADLALCVKFIAGLKDANSREKALDGLALALDKQTVTPPESWAKLQDEITRSGEVRLIALTNKLAVSFRDPAAMKRATAIAIDTTKAVEARTEAIRQLASLKVPNGDELFVRMMNADPEQAVRIEAARGLAAFDKPGLAKQVLADWAKHPAPVKAELVNVLAGRKEWARELLRAMDAKTLARTDVTDNTIIRIQAFNDKDLNALIEKAWGRTRTTPDELLKTIDKMRTELGNGPASFGRGKAVFEANCAKCHQFEGKGQNVGPALDGAGRDIEYILANVIDPNRVIGAPYFLRTLTTNDGRVEQGLLHEEDDKTITLKVENGVLKKFAKADLDGPVKVQEKSMMPEGLTYGMKPDDFRDLVRYVMANPFITDVNVNGKRITAPPTGRIELPDGKGTIEAEVTVANDVKTQLLLGLSGDYTVKLNGTVIATGKSTQPEPDRTVIPLSLPKGTHQITITATGKAVYARLTDLDRKLSYPDVGMKK